MNLAQEQPSRARRLLLSVAAAAALGAAAPAAFADIHIGVILSTTGPAASLGIPEEQTIRMWPAEMAGQKVQFTILNDASDTSTAAKNAARLINEDKVDAIIGASVTPTSLVVVEAAGAAKVPVVSLAGGGAIVLPQDGPRKWAFKLAPTEQLPASNPIKKVALDYVQKFEAKHGAGSRSLFGATAWDAMLMIEQAAQESLKKAKPGTPEFRAGLRDALEGTHEFVGAEGVYNMSPKDHNGVDARSQVLVKIENGTWKLQP